VYFAEVVPTLHDRNALIALVPHAVAAADTMPVTFHVEWDTEEVMAWADHLALPTLAANILEHELTAEDVQEMTREELAGLMSGDASLSTLDEVWGVIHKDRVEHPLRHSALPVGSPTELEGPPVVEPEQIVIAKFRIGYDCMQLCEWLEFVGHGVTTNTILEHDLNGTDLYHCDLNDLIEIFGGAVTSDEVGAMMRKIREFTPTPFKGSFTPEQVGAWLYDQGFSHCADPIIEHGLDGADLLTLRDDEWDDLGVTSEALFEAIKPARVSVAF
jgi:hypothetical protein